MKLCDITQFYGSQSGGIRTYINHKRKYMLEHEIGEHVLIVPGFEDRVVCDEKQKTYYVKSFKIPQRNNYRFMVNREKIKDILKIERPSVVELGSVYVLPLLLDGYLRKNNIPTVGFFHTNFPEAYLGEKTRKFGEHFSKLVENCGWSYAKEMFSKFNLTLSPANFIARKLKELGIEHINLVKIGIDTEMFNPEKRTEIKRSIGIPQSSILLLYVGRLEVEKRINIMINAVKMLPSPTYHLLIIGTGPMQKEVQNLADLYPNKFTWMNYCTDREKLATIYASADIYVTMGPWETFGLSILEAQASGLPVVGVCAGAIPERVLPGTGLLVNPDDTEDLANKIVKLSQGSFKTMGQYARNIVEREYDLEEVMKHQISYYKALLN